MLFRSETVYLVRPNGEDRLLTRPDYYYCGGSEQYLFYVDHFAGESGEGYGYAVGCFEIATGEYWTLPRDGGEDIDIYDFSTDGQVIYSSCPWDHAQTLWHIMYEDGRPTALKLMDEDISE